MKYDWVIARFNAANEQGKYVLGLAHQGIGYFLINKDRTRSDDIIVAFKKAASDQPLPHHLAYADKHQIEKLEAIEVRGQGSKKIITPNTPQQVGAMFPGK